MYRGQAPRTRIRPLAAFALLLVAGGGYGIFGQAQGIKVLVSPTATAAERDTVVFAGGCFWSMQKMFDHVPGVVSTTAGFSGGTVSNPSYETVETGTTGHAESVQVIYDPAKLSYNALVNAYWHSIDPTDGGGTFCDRGPQYRPLIFVKDSTHRRIAEASKATVAGLFKKPLAVQIVSAAPFYAAEEYHQEYYKKNPGRYDAYRRGCGRDQSLERAWADVKKP